MKRVVLVMHLLIGSVAQADTIADITDYLQQQSQSPADYVLSKASSHRVTIIGEAHWLEQDVSFVAALIPALHDAGLDLAAEVFPATQQAEIDNLITSPKWSDVRATAIMRSANWPYHEYRDLLRTAWLVNRSSGKRINILALGPPADWRTSLLPEGHTYDSFMADKVIHHLANTGRSVVVYTGMHHAFTRYYQAELSLTGKATTYMDRMGNILFRRFGEQVFLVALHRPIWCGSPAEPAYCLPFAGRIDCAASKIGRHVGFDVVNSPLSELPFESTDYYAFGHNALRFVDYTDGYVWLGGVDSFRPVRIIALEEFAPDSASLHEVMKTNPFTDEEDVTEGRLREIWAEQDERQQEFLARRKWMHLGGAGCVELEGRNPR
jgi:hypothetical protein